MGSPTGNYSRNMFDEAKRYVQRCVQQGIPWVDADDNDIEQARYVLGRRIEQILGDGASGAGGQGFKCVGMGWDNDFAIKGGDGTAEGAGRYWLSGHQCLLISDVNFKNDGANESEKSIHPRITRIEYQAVVNQTLVDDSAANWDVNEHANKTITPDITQPGSTFTIVSNTRNQLVVDGDATTVAQVGDNYRIEMRTPMGSNRIDGVFLNIYLDEYDCEDDPNLIHNLTTMTCAQLRIKVIQNIYVKEGSEVFPNYTDADGNYHWTFQIARIHRYNGVDAIWDIDDLRKILNDGSIDYSVLQNQGNNLRAVVSNPLSNTAAVLPGWWTLSDRSAIKKFPIKTNTPVFNPVSVADRTRYDLLMIDDTGTLVVKQGVEIVGSGEPFANAPAPDMDKLTLAIIRVNEPSGVVITSEDITDAREFLNIGMAANATANFYAALWLRPHAQAIPNNTVRVEPGRCVAADRTRFINKSVATDSPPFLPISTSGNVRFDLLQIDSNGNLVITQGIEVATPGNPFTNCPTPSSSLLTLAIVRITETDAVIIDSSDVTDMREFLNMGGGGGVPSTYLPDTIRDFYYDDVKSENAKNVTLWMIQPAIRFNSDGTRRVWFSLEKNRNLDNNKHIGFDLWYSLTTDGGSSQIIRLVLDYWVLSTGVLPDILAPTATAVEDIDVSLVLGNVPVFYSLSSLFISKNMFAGLGASQRLVCRLSRQMLGTSSDYSGGAFDLISLVPKLI